MQGLFSFLSSDFRVFWAIKSESRFDSGLSRLGPERKSVCGRKVVQGQANTYSLTQSPEVLIFQANEGF